ncbi:hypothetical protein V8F33_011197 [Rhypophila sp. PSN 637]
MPKGRFVKGNDQHKEGFIAPARPPADDAPDGPMPPAPSHETPQNLNPPSYYCLSKKNAAGSFSYTISQDCTDGQLVRRKRLCAFDGPAVLKKHHALDSRSSRFFKLGDSSERGNDSSGFRSVEELDDDRGLTIEYPPVALVQEEPPKKKIVWPDSVRSYVSRSFADIDPSIPKADIEAKLKETITQATDKGILFSIDWSTMPLGGHPIPSEACCSRPSVEIWPTAKEMERHHRDNHPDKPVMYKCLFDPCPYMSKRESNCTQHMETAHGWTYVRSKKVEQTNAPRSEKLKPIPLPDRSESGEHISESAAGEGLRFGSPVQPVPVQRSYPGRLNVTPGLEALASRQVSTKPTSGVLSCLPTYAAPNAHISRKVKGARKAED